MTIGTLRCEIPVLEPDDDFVDRLAELAAASRPGRGRVVVPVAFGGPASRAVVIAATVAAVTAGAAAAATQLSDAHHDEPAPPGTSIGIQRPGESPRHRHDARATRVADHPTADDVRDQEDGQTQTDTGKTGDAPTTSEPASPVLHEPGGTGPGADDPSSPSEQGNQQGSDDPGDDNGNQSGPQDGDAGNDGGDNTGSDTGSGRGDGDSGGGDDVGSGTSIGGGQDGGGTQGESGDGPGSASDPDPSSLASG